jgi:Flp pilus assembly protein TadD
VDVRHLFIVGLVSSSFVVTGCKSDKSGQSLAANRSSADARAATAMNDHRYDELIKEIEANGGNVDRPQPPQTTTEKIGGAFKTASHTVTDALTLKPKVVKAPDPLALDNMPEKIDIDLYYQAGRVAESSGNMPQAIQHYERGLQEQPKHVPTLVSLARLYDRRDEFQKAEKLYRRAIEAEPDNAIAHNSLGLCLARHDRNEEALVSLRKACQLEPDSKLYHNNLATVLVAMGQVDAAYETLKKVNNEAVAHYNVGYLLYQSNKKEQARQEFKLAFAADASLTEAQDMLSQLNAEIGGSAKTLVARAEPAPPKTESAPALTDPESPTKVQYRIDDLAPQTTDIRKRTVAQPVAMVRSGEPLRRTPATEAVSDLGAPTKTPSPSTNDAPLMPPSGAVGWPEAGDVQPMSGTSDDEPIRLPTPDLLEEVQASSK